MSTEEKKSTAGYGTILNAIRKEMTKIREGNERLLGLCQQLEERGSPAPAAILDQTTTTINVALEHARNVFREF